MKTLTLREIIPQLKGFKKILVTGPQRSGTTIASRILSLELNLKWVTEEYINVDNLEMFFRIHFKEKNYVLQAPGLSFLCDRLPVDAVVFMWRSNKDIKKSAQRIDWIVHDRYESEKYFYVEQFYNMNLPSWDLKKTIFEKLQAGKIKNVFTLRYESLQEHPMYIHSELRKDFHSRQTVLKTKK